MITIEVRNRLRSGEAVANATIGFGSPGLGGTGPTMLVATARSNGRATLDLANVPNGRYTVLITAPESTTDPVGPAIATGATPPERIFRPVEVVFSVINREIHAVQLVPQRNWGSTVERITGRRIRVSLQPVWMKSPNNSSRGTHQPNLIIVHHTGGDVIAGAISTFLGGDVTSAHYVIDTDGSIIKMVQDTRIANHAGVAHWAGNTNVNRNSIGIEIVNGTMSYPEEQYTSLLALLERIRAAFPTIPNRGVVGHSDIATNAGGRLGRKSGDPGPRFQWHRLENRDLGLRLMVGPQPLDIYGGFFQSVTAGAFRLLDNDAAHRFGGAVRRTGVTGNPVREIQSDLKTIGYSIGTPDGDYGHRTHAAVMMFQEHFFAGIRGGTPNGRVDYRTGALIKSVLMG